MAQKRKTTNRSSTASLDQAIDTGDVDALQAAIDIDGASSSQLPEQELSVLSLAISLVQSPEQPDRSEIIDCLLQAGADPNDGGAGQPPPLTVALANLTLYPVQVRRIAEQLVQYGADVSDESATQHAGMTSPLEAAALSGHEDLVIWILHHSPRTEVPPIVASVQNQIHRIDDLASGEHGEAERQRFQSILERLLEFSDAGEVPPLSTANTLLRQRQRVYVGNQSEAARPSPELADDLDRLTDSYADQPLELFEGMEVEFVGSFLPSAADVASMPEQISLAAIDSFDWCDPQRVADAVAAFEKLDFKPIGLFQLAGMDHRVLAYVQPRCDLYGMLEQVDDDQMFCRVIRLWPDDAFQIVTNEDLVVNVDVPGFDYTWKSEQAVLPVIDHFVSSDLSPPHDDRPIVATAEDFVDHYCRGYQVYRHRLIRVLAAMEDGE